VQIRLQVIQHDVRPPGLHPSVDHSLQRSFTHRRNSIMTFLWTLVDVVGLHCVGLDEQTSLLLQKALQQIEHLF